MASVTKISAPDRQAFARADLADLNAVLANFTYSDRKAFWIAIQTYYRIRAEDQG